MRLHRRAFLNLAGSAVAASALPRILRAESYPSRPVHLIVGFAAGGPNDISARLMGQWLSERLGQPFIVENRPGAATNLATELVVHASADCYTLLLVGASAAINATLYGNLNFNFIHDIVPVAGIMRAPTVMVVNPSVPAKTVPEFIAYAKANSGQINMASAGNGSVPHVAGELFKFMAGVDMLHVPYRGDSPALTDLLSGRVQVYFASLPGSIQYIRAGTLRALAVTSATRSAALPDIPVLADFVPGYEATSWFGLGAPKNSAANTVDKLNGETTAGLADSKLKERLADLGGVPMPMSAAGFGKLITDETEKWAEVIKFAGIKPE